MGAEKEYVREKGVVIYMVVIYRVVSYGERPD